MGMLSSSSMRHSGDVMVLQRRPSARAPAKQQGSIESNITALSNELLVPWTDAIKSCISLARWYATAPSKNRILNLLWRKSTRVFFLPRSRTYWLKLSWTLNWSCPPGANNLQAVLTNRTPDDSLSFMKGLRSLALAAATSLLLSCLFAIVENASPSETVRWSPQKKLFILITLPCSAGLMLSKPWILLGTSSDMYYHWKAFQCLLCLTWCFYVNNNVSS